MSNAKKKRACSLSAFALLQTMTAEEQMSSLSKNNLERNLGHDANSEEGHVVAVLCVLVQCLFKHASWSVKRSTHAHSCVKKSTATQSCKECSLLQKDVLPITGMEEGITLWSCTLLPKEALFHQKKRELTKWELKCHMTEQEHHVKPSKAERLKP